MLDDKSPASKSDLRDSRRHETTDPSLSAGHMGRSHFGFLTPFPTKETEMKPGFKSRE